MRYVTELRLLRPSTRSALTISASELPLEGLPQDCAIDFIECDYPGWCLQGVKTENRNSIFEGDDDEFDL